MLRLRHACWYTPHWRTNTSPLSCSGAADGSLDYMAQCCRSLARPIQRMYGSREVVKHCIPNRFADSLPVGAGLGEVYPAIHPGLGQAPASRSSTGESKTPSKPHRVEWSSEHTGGTPPAPANFRACVRERAIRARRQLDWRILAADREGDVVRSKVPVWGTMLPVWTLPAACTRWRCGACRRGDRVRTRPGEDLSRRPSRHRMRARVLRVRWRLQQRCPSRVSLEALAAAPAQQLSNVMHGCEPHK